MDFHVHVLPTCAGNKRFYDKAPLNVYRIRNVLDAAFRTGTSLVFADHNSTESFDVLKRNEFQGQSVIKTDYDDLGCIIRYNRGENPIYIIRGEEISTRRGHILAVGLEPPADTKEVAKRFGISCSASGWIIEKHPKLDPVATMTEGIFVAGAVQGPKDIPSSMAQGSAAAARVLGRINQGEMYLEPIRATVDAEKCSGCRICNNLCPFNAIIFHEEKMVTEINHALCQGCGTCVAACPAGAISGTGFSNEQVLSQIEGLLAYGVPKKADLVEMVPAGTLGKEIN